MKAYLVTTPGPPSALELVELPDPVAEAGQALIEIKAFGLNRAEPMTRMDAPGNTVKFPRVIGIECVGVVLDCPGGELEVGQKVVATSGGLGRQFNGSYAEKTVVPVTNVFPVTTSLDWETLASLPMTYFTAVGSLFETCRVSGKPKVVVRPGASALGQAITQIVNHMGGQVIGVTRSPHKVAKMMETGMHQVIVSGGEIADEILQIWPEGVDAVVDTIASEMTVADNLRMKKPEGYICLAGGLSGTVKNGNKVNFKEALANPYIDFFSSETVHSATHTERIQEVIDHIEQGHYKVTIDGRFHFSELVKAHEQMEQNLFAGKLVVSH